MTQASSPARPNTAATSAPPSVSASHWSAMRWYSVSRVVLAALLLVASWGYDGRVLIDISDIGRFRSIAFVYLVLGIGYLATIRWGNPQFRLLRDLQLLTDLVAIALLMDVAGGVRGGLGVLVVASVAAAAVISNARTAALYAAAGTLVLLAETGIRSWRAGALDASDSLLAGLFGIACFLVAMAVSSLARRLSQQEALAHRRGEDLRNQLAVTQRVIAELDIGVIVVTAHGKVRTMNRAAQEMVGLPGDPFERAQGRAPMLDHVLGPAWRGLQALYLNWRERSGGRPYQGEFAPAPATTAVPGEHRPNLRVRFMRARENEDSDAVLLIEDMHELELRAQQLKLASMGRLSASIAHEIRNPLAAIRHANALLAERLSEASLRRLARIVEDNTVRIDRTIEDVLSLSRRDRSGDESIDMVRFLPAFAAEFTRQAGVEPERVVVSVRSTRALAFDSNHLRRVLANLVGNALRYASTAPGAVSIEWAEGQGDRLELRIADDGPGMSDEALRHAFEPFFTTEGRGTGLGLYLARELCGANGAGIRYERGRSGRYGGGFVIEPRPTGSDAGA